jgi:hypothetical protein
MHQQLTRRERTAVLTALRAYRDQLAGRARGCPASTQPVRDGARPVTVEELDALCAKLRAGSENRLAFGARRPLKVRRLLKAGLFDAASVETVRDLYEQAGAMLDGACSWDICGECLFEGEDGRHYVGTVEFVVGPANPSYVREARAEIGDEEEEPAS